MSRNRNRPSNKPQVSETNPPESDESARPVATPPVGDQGVKVPVCEWHKTPCEFQRKTDSHLIYVCPHSGCLTRHEILRPALVKALRKRS